MYCGDRDIHCWRQHGDANRDFEWSGPGYEATYCLLARRMFPDDVAVPSRVWIGRPRGDVEHARVSREHFFLNDSTEVNEMHLGDVDPGSEEYMILKEGLTLCLLHRHELWWLDCSDDAADEYNPDGLKCEIATVRRRQGICSREWPNSTEASC